MQHFARGENTMGAVNRMGAPDTPAQLERILRRAKTSS
jgi:hypothetical protein